MGNKPSTPVELPEPKLTFPNFDHNTELVLAEIKRQAALNAVLSKGEWLAGKLPTAEYCFQILKFLCTDNSLEEALISAKISDSIARQATSQINAEIKSIKSSIQILNGNITMEERIHEIKIAENGCRIVLNTFSGPGCFLDRPLESSTVLFPFSLIYIEIAKTYLQLGPSPVIKHHLHTIAEELHKTLTNYRDRAVERRLAGIKSDIEVVQNPKTIMCRVWFALYDEYSQDAKRWKTEANLTVPEFNEKVDRYRARVKELYENHFNSFIPIVNDFLKEF